VREALTTEDAAEIRARRDALNGAFHKVSEAMYQRAQEQSGGAPNFDGEDSSTNGGSAAGDEEDVVDAEVVDESN
jgi:molecular chaperone DnaK